MHLNRELNTSLTMTMIKTYKILLKKTHFRLINAN